MTRSACRGEGPPGCNHYVLGTIAGYGRIGGGAIYAITISDRETVKGHITSESHTFATCRQRNIELKVHVLD
jgi:hypothetical protein